MSQPPDPTGVLSFTPVADQFGTAVITVTAENGGPDNNLATPGNNATLTQTFTVVVTEASNEPDPDAPEVRPQLERVREVHIDNSLAGPDPMVFGKSELVGYDTKSFVITHVAAGSTVEKWDAATNQWRDVSTPPTSSNPRQLLQLLQNRIIQKDDQVRWIPKSTDGVTQKAFEIIGWDDGSETSEPEGVNVPGAVENLEIDIVGDEVQVTWDPPTTGAAVTHYRIHQNPTTVVPSTQTSHTFAKKASPVSYAVTVHANSAEGAGEAMTVAVSHGSYVKNDGTVIDPILDTSGNVLDYDGPNLKPNAKLKNVNLKDADLDDANLTGANLIGATLTGADLTGADLTGATLYHVKSGGITKDSSTKLPEHWQLKYGYLLGVFADLTGANLNSANLGNMIIPSVDLSGADLGDATLRDSYLNGSNFNDANLNGADLNSATLNNANLTGADLTYADLTYADLSETTLTNVKANNIWIDPDGMPPELPTNWKLINECLIGPGANLSNVFLGFADLAGMDLTGANLTGANLSGADLSGANLTGATLTNANLYGTGMPNVILTGVRSGGITMQSGPGEPYLLPSPWVLVNGYLIGPGATLVGADLSGEDLSDVGPLGMAADLSGADLSGANLGNTNLGGVDLTGANLTGALLNNADLTSANLTGDRREPERC